SPTSSVPASRKWTSRSAPPESVRKSRTACDIFTCRVPSATLTCWPCMRGRELRMQAEPSSSARVVRSVVPRAALLPKQARGVKLHRNDSVRGGAMTTGMSGEGPVWSLPEVHLEALAAHGTVKAYPKNAVIVNEGDRSDSMYIVLSGRVKAYLADEDGKEVL